MLCQSRMLIVLLILLVFTGGCSSEEMATTQAVESPPQYLEQPIAPCSGVPGTTRDPCDRTPQPDLGSVAATVQIREIPAYWNLYFDLAEEPTIFTPHIAIRGTYLPNTTRCEVYQRKFPDFTNFSLPSKFYLLGCFTDLRVNDYLTGQGPPTLTVESYGLPILYEDGDPLGWTEGTRTQVAKAYEGREGVILLAPSSTTVVEAWWAVEFWDVQQSGDEVAVVAPFKKELEQHGLTFIDSQNRAQVRPITTEELALLELPLDEFERIIAGAAVKRATETEGRIGIGDHLPMLITDANMLRPYYEGPGVGIVYETDAPAKPPPVPGSEDPIHPPGKVDDGEDNTGTTGATVPLPGDEDTPTPPKDPDATTTTTSISAPSP